MSLTTPAALAGRGPFYKLTNKEELHYGLQYKTGLMRDPVAFNPSGKCSAGGMYFFARNQLKYFTSYVRDPCWIREVTFTENSLIYEEEHKFKANEFALGERAEFWLPADVELAAVQETGYALRYVKEQTPELCLAAVQENGYALELVKDQTPELCLAAVQHFGCVLRFVKNQTPEMCLAAVQQRGYALRYVKEQTPELCRAAVQQESFALQYVKERFSYLFQE